jgi:hypothetical protein
MSSTTTCAQGSISYWPFSQLQSELQRAASSGVQAMMRRWWLFRQKNKGGAHWFHRRKAAWKSIGVGWFTQITVLDTSECESCSCKSLSEGLVGQCKCPSRA